MSLRRSRAVREPSSAARERTRKATGERHLITALARGLTVLSCFRAGDTMLSNGQIAERCHLPKSTVSRLTYTLTETGYLEYVAERAMYRLGVAALGIGTAVLSRMNARQIARPLMQELANYSESVVALGMRVHLGMIYVEVCRSPSALTLSLDVGSRLPFITSAMGRAYFVVAPEDERKRILHEVRTTEGVSWTAARVSFDEGAKEYARLGCCTSFGMWQPDVNGVAVGVRNAHGPTMAINCGGPSFKLRPDFLIDKVRPRLIEVARKLEIALRQD